MLNRIGDDTAEPQRPDFWAEADADRARTYAPALRAAVEAVKAGEATLAKWGSVLPASDADWSRRAAHLANIERIEKAPDWVDVGPEVIARLARSARIAARWVGPFRVEGPTMPPAVPEDTMWSVVVHSAIVADCEDEDVAHLLADALNGCAK